MLIESLTVVYREHFPGDLCSSQSKKWIFWFLHLALMNLVNVNHGSWSNHCEAHRKNWVWKAEDRTQTGMMLQWRGELKRGHADGPVPLSWTWFFVFSRMMLGGLNVHPLSSFVVLSSFLNSCSLDPDSVFLCILPFSRPPYHVGPSVLHTQNIDWNAVRPRDLFFPFLNLTCHGTLMKLLPRCCPRSRFSQSPHPLTTPSLISLLAFDSLLVFNEGAPDLCLWSFSPHIHTLTGQLSRDCGFHAGAYNP